MNPPPGLEFDEFGSVDEPVEAVGRGEGEGVDPFVGLPLFPGELGFVGGVGVPEG